MLNPCQLPLSAVDSATVCFLKPPAWPLRSQSGTTALSITMFKRAKAQSRGFCPQADLSQASLVNGSMAVQHPTSP